MEENNGISLKEIFKTIWLRKWVALIVAVAVTLVMAVALFYGYNPTVKTYEVEFSLNLPGSDNGAFYSYPDGKIFHYTDVTSAETLKTVKDSDEFSNVNVDKMVKKGHIGITRDITVTTVTPATAETVGNSYREVTYTVSVKSSYFNGKEQAKEFLTCVASYPTKHLESMKIDYDIYLSTAESATDKIECLTKQRDFLVGEYKKLIKTYGETFVVNETGKTLLACSQEVEAYVVSETSLNDIKDFTESFQNTSKAVYAKATSVVFVQPSVIVEKGGMGLMKILLLSVIVAVIVALVAAYVAGNYKLKALKAAENLTETEENSKPANEENKE